MKVCKLPKSNTLHKTIIHKLLINKQLIQALKNMKKKELYIAPKMEQVELELNDGILTVSGGGSINNASEEDYGLL